MTFSMRKSAALWSRAVEGILRGRRGKDNNTQENPIAPFGLLMLKHTRWLVVRGATCVSTLDRNVV